MALCHLRRDILTLRLVTVLASVRSPALDPHLAAKLDTYLLELGHRAPFVVAVLGKTVRILLNRERGRAPYL